MRTRAELHALMESFLKDRKRGISIELFAELAGIDVSTLRNVCINNKTPMTARTQGALDRAWNLWDGGYVRIEKKGALVRMRIEREPKPLMRRTFGVRLTENGPTMRVGVKKRSDYTS